MCLYAFSPTANTTALGQTHTPLAPMPSPERITRFVDVIIPLRVPNTYTYRLPVELNDKICVGARVIVQFGRSKVLTAVVQRIHEQAPANYQAKYVLDLLDEYPLVTEAQLRLFAWIAEYYMCTLGEVLMVALPSGLKITSMSRIQRHPSTDASQFTLSAKEEQLLQALEHSSSLTYEEAAQILEVKNVYNLIKSLIHKDLIIVYEELKDSYQPKRLKKIRLHADYASQEAMQALLTALSDQPRKVKQLDALMYYIQTADCLRHPAKNQDGLEKQILTEQGGISQAVLKALREQEILEEFEVNISRFEELLPTASIDNLQLSEAQTRAYQELHQQISQHTITLLHGVTGSGKTEIYIRLIQDVLNSGAQVLFLLPEIALTTQIVARLQRFFGSSMGVYHSRFSDNERVEVWQGIVSGKYSFVVGVRSAVFLPFDNLGLIIVDEEHEPSYKQYDPAPRYHARDVATVIAQQQGCKVLFGSATPSIETYYQASHGKYGLVSLSQRYGEAQLPFIVLSDMREERRAKTIQQHFGQQLLGQMQEALGRQDQIILFQNRRGYAPFVMCRTCSWVPKCPNCDVSLTLHLHSQELRCHYCGHQAAPIRSCQACGAQDIETVGHGTEKIEESLKSLLPQAKVARMDLDTTRRKSSYQRILQEFEARQIDILVGTQMISKGLDFDHVSLVGIFDIDRMMHFPDFRANERAYQIMTQVSGRAGRKHKAGLVIIQTYDATQPLFSLVQQNDYLGLYHREIEEREKFHYPPFSRLIQITLRHPEAHLCEAAARELKTLLARRLGERLLGPEKPLIGRIRNKYLYHLIIKIERQHPQMKAIKAFIQEQCDKLLLRKEYRQLDILPDVDPV